MYDWNINNRNFDDLIVWMVIWTKLINVKSIENFVIWLYTLNFERFLTHFCSSNVQKNYNRLNFFLYQVTITNESKVQKQNGGRLECETAWYILTIKPLQKRKTYLAINTPEIPVSSLWRMTSSNERISPFPYKNK